jgi:5-oxoprolinase (ATP-hydrolysing) subunit C
MFEVIKKGLETSLQDYPGRVGFLNQGFPPSGPMDSWSFRLANLVVGNNAEEAALECQFMGPTLKFETDHVISICGGDMQPKIDGVAIPLWESILIKTGQTLELSFCLTGARTYIAFSGGIKSDLWLGSKSTFHKAAIGGIEGSAIKDNQKVQLGISVGQAGKKVKKEVIPKMSNDGLWEIEVVRGPNDDWLDNNGYKIFLAAKWKLQARSDRTGFRLDGPLLTFTEKATDKSPEHGYEPSNIIDQGYPVGGINLAGQTPIILVNDGPSMGGFIVPFTVPSASFWKLGQAKPNEHFKFREISVEESQEMRSYQTSICSEKSII